MSIFSLEVKSISKAFGGTPALSDVSITVSPGEIHALLGHNGSGKSTLIKVISGYHKPDSGEVSINDVAVHYPTNALSLKDLGASFMHQDIGLVPSLSILENLRVGRFEKGFLGRIRWSEEALKVESLLGAFGLTMSPHLLVSDLSASERSVIGLMRAFQDVGADTEGDISGLIVLDEPTAALPEAEKDILFSAIKEVAGRGVGVLLVTHHLEEPLQFADRVSVLRDGRLIITDDTKNHDYESLADLVMGEHVGSIIKSSARNESIGDEVLNIKGLSSRTLSNVSFKAHRGEIVGLTGLMGAGHEEIPFLIYGAAKAASGDFRVLDSEYKPDPVNARKLGIALVSGDRLRAGGVLTASISENLSLPLLGSLVGRFGWLRSEAEESIVNDMLAKFKIKLKSPFLPFSILSGGNQQKALIGRWVESSPQVLLLQEPTAGVDIGASQDVIMMLKKFAHAGGSVMFSSEQYEDVANLSDRVLVFRRGKVVSVLENEDVTVENIVDASYGREVLNIGDGSK